GGLLRRRRGFPVQGDRRHHGHPHRYRDVPAASRPKATQGPARRRGTRAGFPPGRAPGGQAVSVERDPDMEMDCTAVLTDVWLMLDGECDEATRARLQHHMDHCSPCIEAYGIEEKIKGL